MIRSLAAAAALCLGLAAAPARAEPPLWVIRDADSTIYLFGSSHALKPEVKWRSPTIDKAFAESEELWTETHDTDEDATRRLFAQHGLDESGSLSAKLDEASRAKLVAAAAKVEIPMENIEVMQPWFAMMFLSVAALMKDGATEEAGVETVLEAEATRAGKPLRGLETAESSVRLIAGMSEAAQIASLKETLREFDQEAAMDEALTRAWTSGDVEALERAVMDEMAEEPAELVERLLTRRNAAWAEVLAERLEGKGVSFVAVGAAHLVGPDSVQKLLEKKGIRAERVDPAGLSPAAGAR